jgi:hypothetical protein
MGFQSSRSDEHLLADVRPICRAKNIFFAHLNPPLPFEIQLDETDNEILSNGIWHAKAFATLNSHIFDNIARRLNNGLNSQH